MKIQPSIQAVLDAITEVIEEITTNGNVKTDNLKKTRALMDKVGKEKKNG